MSLSLLVGTTVPIDVFNHDLYANFKSNEGQNNVLQLYFANFLWFLINLTWRFSYFRQ